MRIFFIVSKLRSAGTHFGNYIGGAADLELVRHAEKIDSDFAFVIPLQDRVSENRHDSTIEQTITERFAVVVILQNDSSQSEKMGIIAYDKLHYIRSEIFRALIGWELYGAISPISYDGGQLLPLNPAYMWYQFSFKYDIRLSEYDGYCDVEGAELFSTEGSQRIIQDADGQFRDWLQVSQLPELQKIYTNYVQYPEGDLPYYGDLPLEDGFPDVSIPDFAQLITLEDDKNPGAFGRGFASDYDFYRILNRADDPK